MAIQHTEWVRWYWAITYGIQQGENNTPIRGLASACLCKANKRHMAQVLGKYYIVTAAHCICIKDITTGQKKFADKITFLLDKKRDEEGIPIDIQQIYIHKDYNFQQDDGTDITFLVPKWKKGNIPVEEGISLKFPCKGLKMVPRIYDPQFRYHELGICGYPGELASEGCIPVGMKFDSGQQDNGEEYMKTNRKGNTLYYTKIQTTPGQNGAPILRGLRVIGVHATGDGKAGFGTVGVPFKYGGWEGTFEKYGQ